MKMNLIRQILKVKMILFLTALSFQLIAQNNSGSANAQHILPERIFLHTDKDFYLSGEIIWFKIYQVDGASHKPIQLSKLAYVELLDANNKPVVQAKIPLEKNQNHGSFRIPFSLENGKYLLRAYTNLI